MLVYVINSKPSKKRKNPNNLADVIPAQGKFIALTPKLHLAINRKELLRVNTVATTGEIQFDQSNKAHLAAKVAYDELNKFKAYSSAKQAMIKNVNSLLLMQKEYKEILEKMELQGKLVLSSIKNVESFEEEFLNEEDVAFISLVELHKMNTQEFSVKGVDVSAERLEANVDKFESKSDDKKSDDKKSDDKKSDDKK